jgi:FkbM family methyltransferase
MCSRFWDKSKEIVIFDIGANLGDFTLLVANQGKFKIHCFEPNPKTYKELLKNTFKIPNLQANNLAIVSTPELEKLTLFAPENTTNKTSALCSLIDREVFHTWTDVSIEKYEVQCITIDKYCEQKNINKIDYLKVDVEGFEFEVFKGSKNCFENKIVRSGQFEYGTTFKEAKVNLSDVVGFLNDYGCKTFYKDLKTVVSPKVKDSYDWINFFFIRKDLL